MFERIGLSSLPMRYSAELRESRKGNLGQEIRIGRNSA